MKIFLLAGAAGQAVKFMMHLQKTLYLQKVLHRSSFLLIMLTSFLSILALAAWMFDHEFFAKSLSGLRGVDPATAFMFVLLSFSFFLFFSSSVRSIRYSIFLALLVSFFATAKLINIVLDFPSPLDEMLPGNTALQQNEASGRMAANTTLSFLFGSVALLFAQSRKTRAFQWIALFIIFLSLFTVLGSIFKVPELFHHYQNIPMVPYAAIGFLLFSLALLFVQPDKGLMKTLTCSGEDIILFRTLIIAAGATPLMLAYVCLLGYRNNFFSAGLAIAIFIICIAVVFTFVVYSIISALNKRSERYAIVSKATNDAIWDWRIDRDAITWNHGLKTIFHYTSDDSTCTRDWWKEKIHPEDVAPVFNSIEKAFEEKQNTWKFTYRFRSGNGTYKHICDRAYILYDEKDRPRRMIGSKQDITDRMTAHEAIEKLSFVASKTDNAVMITDPEENIEWVNEAFVKMTGYSAREIKGRKPDFLYGAETSNAITQHINVTINRGMTFSGQLVNYTKSGRKYWVKNNVTPVLCNDGKVKNFISIQSDITFQKEFENRITAIAREFESLIENANVPVFGIDRNGYINEWNKVTARLLGFTKSEIYERRWVGEMIDSDHHVTAFEMQHQVLSGKPVGNLKLPVLTKDKKRLIVLLSASPRRDADRNITGAILVAQDITELIEYRQNLEKMVQDRTLALNQALEKEKALVDAKSKFVSIASHEFRTPLSTISLTSGFIKKFRHKLSDEDINRKLDHIEKQVGYMTCLLDDVLMVGKAEAGKIVVRPGEVDIPEFFERISAEIEHATGHTHCIRIKERLAVRKMVSDEKLMRNITINLLTNAVKFSPGASFVDVCLESDSATLSIQITDYGIGIPPDEREKIFEPFYRGSNVNVIQGTGLGLSIIKKAVNLLEGSVHVKSEVGSGTVVSVFLPVKA